MFFQLCESTAPQYEGPAIGNAAVAAAHAAKALKSFATSDQETLIAIPLNAGNCAAAPILISVGGQTFAPCDCKILFRRLLAVQANCFILAHNHPSGDPTPSTEDLAMTAKVREAGEALDLHLLDHIVLGAGGVYTSIRDIITR